MRPLGGGDPVLAGQVAGGDDGAARQGWSRRTITSARSRASAVRARWPGIGRGRSPQLCTTPRSACPEATRLMASHGSRSVRVTRRSGCAARTGGRAGAIRPRIAVENAVSRTCPATVPACWCSPDWSSSRPASRRVPCSTRCLPCLVSMTPRPTRSSSGTPVCFSRRLTCWDTALGVKPSASAAATTEPWVPTARSASRATRSIMKQCYMVDGRNIRWCFIVGPGHTGGVNRRDTAPRRPRRRPVGLQLRRHRLGHGDRAAAAVRGDPVHRGRRARLLPRAAPAGAVPRRSPRSARS